MRRFLRRQRALVDYSMASLLRRKGKNLSLLLVYTLLVFLLASVLLYTQALRKEATLVLANSPEIIVQRLVAGRHAFIPAQYLKQLGDVRGVTYTQGRLWGYYYDPVVKANYTLMATGNKGLAVHEIAIGAGIARTRQLTVGDYLSLRNARGAPETLRVKEILYPDSELLSADLMLLNPESWRQFFAVPQAVYTDLTLAVRNPAEINKVAEKIVQRLPDTRPILKSEILRSYDAVFSWREGLVSLLLSVALLAFVIFAWDKASGLSAEERREIGILKAIGWETSDVLRMKLWEGAIVSLTAFLSGYLLAYAHIFFTSAALLTPILKGWAVLYPEFHVIPYIDYLQVATLFFFTVVPYAVATLIPIWKAAITDPDEVMR